jgi:hypothetical protein
MKAIETKAIITGIRSKVDRSLGLTVATPETTVEERAEFMNLQGNPVTLFIQPDDMPQAPLLKVRSDIQNKTSSERLRAVLFVYYKTLSDVGDFEDFYKREMEKLIDHYKGKLN